MTARSEPPARANALRLRRFVRLLRPLKTTDINPAVHGPFRRAVAFVGSLLDLTAYVYLLIAGVAALSRKFGGAVGATLQPLHAGFPVVIAPTIAVVLFAVLRRRLLLVLLSGILAVTGWFAVAPAIGTTSPPPWSRTAPTLTIAAANLLFTNPTPEAAAKQLLDLNADVVVVIELTEQLAQTLDASGFATAYPNRSLVPQPHPTGAGIYSRLPIVEIRRWGDDRLPDVDLQLPNGELVRIVAIHPMPPTDRERSGPWRQQLKRLADRAFTETAIPFVAVGDFNGTRWQPGFGQLLEVLSDVHEMSGKGLSRSWPANTAGLPLLFRLDHALVNDRFVPLALRDVPLVGSDHVAFLTTLAVRSDSTATIVAPDTSL